MSQFAQLSAGNQPPDDINVIIEIPAHAGPVKYEVDKENGLLQVDRFMTTSMVYPANYGYLPQSLAEDGDPADVLVVTPVPLLSGSSIRCRPVALMKMEDEAGGDNKILAFPHAKLTPQYQNIQSLADVDQWLLDSIAHFFTYYKALEKNKWAKVSGWFGIEEARQEIVASLARFNG